MKYFIIAIFILTGISGFSQHTLFLKSGEKMNGEVQSINNNIISFAFKGTTMSFKVAEVKSILFDAESAVGSTPTSSGTISGMKGVAYVMPGRKMIKQPKIDNLTTEKGIVVIDITVNKYGNVIKAEPGGEGTTTTSQYLLTKGKQAAESVMFDTNPTMPLEQKGSITITF
ncbi:hypothetical protein BH11BAC2_BH11BAC2_13730 [soil metagenome]